jgi:hypothetical protein
MKRAVLFVLLAAVVVLFVAACTAGPNEMADVPDEEGKVAGFWQGLWHGIIAPITFVISLFSDTIEMFEVHNNGGWYNFGFLFGLTAVWGGGGAGASRRRRRRD